jgi:hypothetical protein
MYSNTPNPPSKFTATMWGKTVTIELDHSDIDLNEVMDIFKGLAIASGFEMISWNSVIKDLAADIYDYEREDLKEKLNEWKFDDEDEDEYKDLRHSYGSWSADSEGHEFGDKDDEIIEEEPNEEEANRRMDIIGQNGNEGTHYGFNWDGDYEGETNDILTNINDSIQIIKDRMEDIDLRMDNIDEQLGILNADVANLEIGIAFPPPNEHILKAKDLYDRTVKVSERDKERRNDYVDMESGEVSNDGEDTNNGGFDGKALFTPYKRKPNQKVTEKVMSNEVRLGKWQTDNKTKEVVKLDKTKVRKGKIKDLKK